MDTVKMPSFEGFSSRILVGKQHVFFSQGMATVVSPISPLTGISGMFHHGV